jgi:hypothetical protein
MSNLNAIPADYKTPEKILPPGTYTIKGIAPIDKTKEGFEVKPHAFAVGLDGLLQMCWYAQLETNLPDVKFPISLLPSDFGRLLNAFGILKPNGPVWEQPDFNNLDAVNKFIIKFMTAVNNSKIKPNFTIIKTNQKFVAVSNIENTLIPQNIYVFRPFSVASRDLATKKPILLPGFPNPKGPQTWQFAVNYMIESDFQGNNLFKGAQWMEYYPFAVGVTEKGLDFEMMDGYYTNRARVTSKKLLEIAPLLFTENYIQNTEDLISEVDRAIVESEVRFSGIVGIEKSKTAKKYNKANFDGATVLSSKIDLEGEGTLIDGNDYYGEEPF